VVRWRKRSGRKEGTEGEVGQQSHSQREQPKTKAKGTVEEVKE
jgi:hypothetical protein